MKGIVITASDEISVCEFSSPLYKSVGKAVGGWIEIVHPKELDQPYCMIVNEEGLIRNLDFNATGSFLYDTQKHGFPILGDIVIMKEGYTQEGPDIIGLSDSEAEEMFTMFKNKFNLKEIKQ